jgi:hypothetical protein
MDGEVTTYENVTVSVLSGTLHIFQYQRTQPAPIGEWHFPVVNIRAWGPEKWEPGHTGRAARTSPDGRSDAAR